MCRPATRPRSRWRSSPMDRDAQHALTSLHATLPDTLSQEARHYAEGSRAHSTQRAYATDFRLFAQWCAIRQRLALPAEPQTIANYLAELARTKKPSTIEKKLAAISVAHQLAGYVDGENPARHGVVRAIMRSIRREHGTRPKKKEALLAESIRRVIGAITQELEAGPAWRRMSALRDRALLLIGFAGGFRRSELVALEIQDVAWYPQGIRLTIRRSKTDQEGAGRDVPIRYGEHEETCPVRALRVWLEAARIDRGPLFVAVAKGGQHLGFRRLAGEAVAAIVKRRVRAVGLDPEDFAGHSLRAGFATTAFSQGASELEVMEITGHTSLATLREYLRAGRLWNNTAGAKLGL
ncbi:site-specific integrase [bacterium]|nr:MAG: site-specific integrase [bacterium]